jgi:hypothetical protein
VTVGGAVGQMVRHPVHFLAARWNWKAALLSALMRGGIFFGTALDSGLAPAARALVVDATFRVPMAGACAAVVQELRWAEPRWAAVGIAVLAVPAASHAIEIVVHYAAATPLLWRGVTASIGLSVVSSAIELALMRAGVMLVGPGAGSLLGDLRRVMHLERRGAG